MVIHINLFGWGAWPLLALTKLRHCSDPYYFSLIWTYIDIYICIDISILTKSIMGRKKYVVIDVSNGIRRIPRMHATEAE
jgi:hypothetical protein